ncbi:hypothetical protein FN846DRAFT_889672 [Sphaerosporella brunnea]|uniref:Uncharacterized protein n=1 Tax=Sphaerosporella brunnea TaxID=1250544 RepID=A0A5J5EZQ9_9PEZI|nr:hypothetical protein FN846DRAFT_889672 [Sphaerosporella brunnea]
MGTATYKHLFEELGIDSSELQKLSIVLEQHFVDHQEWFPNKSNLPSAGGALGGEQDDYHQRVVQDPRRTGAAAKKLVAERVLAAEIRTEGATLEVAASRSRVDHADQEMSAVDIRTGVRTLEALDGITITLVHNYRSISSRCLFLAHPNSNTVDRRPDPACPAVACTGTIAATAGDVSTAVGLPASAAMTALVPPRRVTTPPTIITARVLHVPVPHMPEPTLVSPLALAFVPVPTPLF